MVEGVESKHVMCVDEGPLPAADASTEVGADMSVQKLRPPEVE